MYTHHVHEVNMINVYTFCEYEAMESMADRLRRAREKKGIPSARQAALKLNMAPSSYAAHENGQNEYDAVQANRYGRLFGVSPGWLLTGSGEDAKLDPEERRQVPLVGYVGAGATAHFFNESGPLGEVDPPEGATEDTVAVEIRGDSLGAALNGWLAFYDRVQRPVTADLIGHLCVVGIDDGRILVKKLARSRARGRYHLISQEPMLDVAVDWAAKVKLLRPRR